LGHVQAETAGEQAVLAAGVQVGQQNRDGLTDKSATVDDDPQAAQHEPRVLHVEQFAGGQVDGYLVVVLFPARRRAFTCDDWLRRDGAQQLRDPGNAYPA
jgi:hypothetical protein